MVRPAERDEREMGAGDYRPHLHRQGIHPRPREGNYCWRNESASIASSWNLSTPGNRSKSCSAAAGSPDSICDRMRITLDMNPLSPASRGMMRLASSAGGDSDLMRLAVLRQIDLDARGICVGMARDDESKD